MLRIAKTILERVPLHWELPGRWEMREVEHWLCEYDKYRRAASGKRMKRKFTPPPQNGGRVQVFHPRRGR